MTKEKKSWLKIGYSLFGFAVVVPIVTRVSDFLLTKANIEAMGCKGLTSFKFSFQGSDFGIFGVFILAGILCILPVNDWILSWRGGKKK